MDNTIRDQNEVMTPKTLDKDEIPSEVSRSLKHTIRHEDSRYESQLMYWCRYTTVIDGYLQPLRRGKRKRRRSEGAITDTEGFLSVSLL